LPSLGSVSWAFLGSSFLGVSVGGLPVFGLSGVRVSGWPFLFAFAFEVLEQGGRGEEVKVEQKDRQAGCLVFRASGCSVFLFPWIAGHGSKFT